MTAWSLRASPGAGMWLLPSNRSARPLVARPAGGSAARREGGVDEHSPAAKPVHRTAPRSADCRRARRRGPRRIAFDTTVVQDRLRAGCSPAPASRPRNSATISSRASRPSSSARAVDAATLGQDSLADKAAAAKQYGVAAGDRRDHPGQVHRHRRRGQIRHLQCRRPRPAADIKIRMQTGPAINGTDLRDATGEINFGDFKNQIEYQNAGAGINNAMKKAVLAGSTPGAHRQDRHRHRRLHPRQPEELAGHPGGDRWPMKLTDAPAASPDAARGRPRRPQRRQVLRRHPGAQGRQLRHPPRPGDDARSARTAPASRR